jgi:glucose/arabinose dehydrogenase
MTGVDRRTLLKAGLAAGGGLALGLGSGVASPASAAPRIDRTLAKGLGVPWGMAFLPTGNALVGERDSGDLHVVERGGGRRRVGHLDAFSQVSSAGESGLLGLALHPGFRTNRWVYAYLSTSHDNRIVRFR